MRIVVLSEYVSRQPWAPDRWAVAMARALKTRGHEIVFACDGRDDAADLTGFDAFVHRPDRDRSKRRPMRFARWARSVRRDVPHDASVSFTPLVPGDVWAPIGPTELGRVRALVRRNLLSTGLDVVGRPWLAPGVAASTLATCTDRRAQRCRIGRSPDDPGGLGFGAGFAERRTDARAQTRAALGLAHDEIAAVVSAVGTGTTTIGDLLGGLSLTRSRSAARTPTVVIATRGQHTVLRLAERFGVGDFVRIIGPVGDMSGLLTACDAAIAPRAAGATATGRFIADALACRTPVLCSPNAPGAELISADPSPGMVLPGTAAPEWRTALERLSDREWLSSCADAAEAIGGTLSPDAVGERLESVLAACAEKRPRR
jgi:hypothetical protein